MKRSRVISVGVILLVLGGFLLTILTGNSVFILWIFGLFSILAIISIPLYFRKFHKEYKNQEKKPVDVIIEDINEQDGYNGLEYDVHQVKTVVDTWKHRNKGDVFKSILFVSFFLCCIIGFIVCMSFDQMVWGFICFGLGVGEIIIALIIVKLLERRAIVFKKGRTYRKTTAVVLGSVVSSQSSFGSRNHQQITNTLYKVFLKINEKKVITYSKEYYDVGDRVYVNIDEKNPKIIQIISKQEDIFAFEEKEF